MSISVIIPTLNEEAAIEETLKRLTGQEIIISDGGSTDRTMEIARRLAKVVPSPCGRGCQMNSGAREASGDTLLFLHADTILPDGWADMIRTATADERVIGGAFSLSIDSGKLSHRIIAATANLRSRFLGLPYGDQGIFVKTSVFKGISGFKDIPIMEDVDLVRRLKKTGKVVLLKDKVTTSARRWEREGVVYTTIRNWSLMTLYLIGFPPERLYRFYKTVR